MSSLIEPVNTGEIASIAASEDEFRPIGATIPVEQQDKIVKFVLGVKSESEIHYAEKRRRWHDYWEHYTNKKRTRTRTTIPVPLASEQVDVVLADMLDRQFATKPFVSVRGRNIDDAKKAPAVEGLLQYQYETLGIFDIYYKIAKECLIFGSCPWRIAFDEDFIEVPVPGLGETNIMRFSGPVIDVFDIFDYFPSPSKVDANDAAPAVFRSYRPYEYFVERHDKDPDLYFNLSKIPNKRAASTITDNFNEREEREAELGRQPEGVKAGVMEVLECDAWWPVEKRDGTWIKLPYIFTVANNQLIRAERNPYVSQHGNAGVAKIDSLPNELFGVGLVEKIHPQIHGANTVLDMMLTNLEHSVNRKKIVNTDLVKNESELRRGIGGIVHSRGNVNEAMKWEDVLNVVPDAYNILGLFIGGAEAAGGVKPVKTGVASEKTATATIRAGAEASKRFLSYMMSLENSFVKPSASFMHKINQQFLDLPQIIPILGPEVVNWEEVTNETIAISPDFIPEGSTRDASRQLNIAQIEKFLMIVAKVPGLAPILPMLVGKLAREFRWQDAKMIEDVAAQAMQQMGIQLPGGEGGQGSINQIASPGNAAGVDATNVTDLNQSVGSEFGISSVS